MPPDLAATEKESCTNHEVVKIGLLCPVIANMGEFRAGQIFGLVCKDHSCLGKGLVYFASWLPSLLLQDRLEEAFVEHLKTPNVYRSSLVSLVVDFLQQPHSVTNAVKVGVDALDRRTGCGDFTGSQRTVYHVVHTN